MSLPPTVEFCQILITYAGIVTRVIRAGKVLPEYEGASIDVLKTELESDGWIESGRWIVKNATDQIQVSFRRG